MTTKKSDDYKLTVPQVDLTLGDIPITQEKVDALQEGAMLTRTPKAIWRAEIATLFYRAKRKGLAEIALPWSRRRPKKAGAPDRYLEGDLEQKDWLIEQIADAIPYHSACRKAEVEGRIGGGVTDPGSRGRRLARRFNRRTMEALGEALRKQRSM